MTGALTRSQRRIHEEFHHMQKSYDDMDAYTAKLEKEHEQVIAISSQDDLFLTIFFLISENQSEEHRPSGFWQNRHPNVVLLALPEGMPQHRTTLRLWILSCLHPN